MDEANHRCVVCKLYKFHRWVNQGTVVGEEGEEQWGKNTPLRRASADGTYVERDASQSHLLSPAGEEIVNPLTGGGRHGELGGLIFQSPRIMVLNTELKSTNMICAYVPGDSRWRRMECSPMLIASSTDLFAQ